MAQKINVNTFRLKKKLMWWSTSHINLINTNFSKKGLIIFHEDLLIRQFIEGIFKSFNILVSEIVITRKPLMKEKEKSKIENLENNLGLIKISFLINDYSHIKEIINLKTNPIKEIKNNKIKYKSVSILAKSFLSELINRPYKTKNGSIKNIMLNEIFLDIREVPNVSYNVKLLADWIALEMTRNMNTIKRHKNIIKNAEKLLTK